MTFEPLSLDGPPAARGAAQAALCPDSVDAVRAAYAARLDGARALLARPNVTRFLAVQWDFANTHDVDGIAELTGIAAGYGLDPKGLFAWLHVGQLGGLISKPLGGLPDDGCSAWAFAHPEAGAIVIKNRDLRGNALPLQRVFRHRDPAWGERSVLCVVSLGAPGAYSSGINSDGLALVDTQVVTTDQGVGLLRYFLMTRLLARCGSVAAAIEALHVTRHAGGGTLVLADATGAIATVEIGHSALAVARPSAGWVARTNHFLAPDLARRLAAQPGDPGIDVSHARLAMLTGWLAARAAPPSLAEAAAIMASHDGPGCTGLCRHGAGGGSNTVSASVYDCASRTLHFVHGNPCQGVWARYDLARKDGRGSEDGVRDGSGR
jgi:isopenicillin-N N-acyltransferase-like protein